MPELLKQLVFKWCKESGDKVHTHYHEDWHTYRNVWNPYCGHCNDFLHFAEDVLKLVVKRLS